MPWYLTYIMCLQPVARRTPDSSRSCCSWWPCRSGSTTEAVDHPDPEDLLQGPGLHPPEEVYGGVHQDRGGEERQASVEAPGGAGLLLLHQWQLVDG